MNNKQLLQQYVDTGVQLPEYQVRSLPPDLLKTYLRKRLMVTEDDNSNELSDYEFELLTQEQRFQYAMKRNISDKQFELLTPVDRFQYAMKRVYTMKRVKKFSGISDKQFELLTPVDRFQYAMKRMGRGYPLNNEQFELLSPDQQKIFKDKGGVIIVW